MSAKLLSMICICWTWGKVGFCKMFLKRGTLQKSGRKVLREEIVEKNKNVIFLINFATH